MSRELQDILESGEIDDILLDNGYTPTADAKVANKEYVDDGLALKRDLTDSQFGDATDNAGFESDGTLVLAGDATGWMDVNFDPTNLTGNGTAPTRISWAATGLTVAGFRGGGTDEVEACVEYPHEAKLNASGETTVTMTFHCHVFPTTTTGGNIRLELEYLFTDGVTPVTTSTTILVTQAVGTTAWAKIQADFANVPVPDGLGQQLVFKFSRLGGDALDTYAGLLAITTIGFHCEIDTPAGSRAITTK